MEVGAVDTAFPGFIHRRTTTNAQSVPSDATT
jgi:hypothetical protein